MTRSRSVLCSKIFAGSSLIIAMIGVSACTSTPGVQSLAVSPPTYTPLRVAYNDTAHTTAATDAAPDIASETARTGEDRNHADLMPIGGPTPAPLGFLDLCQRSPADCQHAATFEPEKIRTLARAATAERYRLAFAAIRQKAQGDGDADMQSASVSPLPGDNAPAATTGAVQYPARDAGVPLGYAQPLRQPGLRPLAAPATGGYVSDFLDLSIDSGAWTQLGAAAPAHLAGDVQPGAVSGDGAPSTLLNWSHKSEATDYAAVVPVSAEAVRAPSIQYDIPDEPYDWAHVRLPAPAAPDERQPMQAEVTAQADTLQADAVPADYQRITMDPNTARLLRAVNDQVNSIMRGATDEDVYHVADYWNAPPLVRGVRGDCEDFALEKRRLLIENGIPAAAISIAIVRTRLGEDHAVLIVSSWQGDYVLDNLQHDVRPWRKAGYTWVSRQGPGDDLGWVSLVPANGRARSPWQARTMRVAYAQ